MHSLRPHLAELFVELLFWAMEENIQSWIQGNWPNSDVKFGYLLLSTGNKSEMAVGCYNTLRREWQPWLSLLMFPKPSVYSLYTLAPMLEGRESENHFIPYCRGSKLSEKLFTKEKHYLPSSAELKPGQVDQRFALSYRDYTGRILQPWFTATNPLPRLFGWLRSAICRPLMIQPVARAEFKRRQAPLDLRLLIAFGTRLADLSNKWVSVKYLPGWNLLLPTGFSATKLRCQGEAGKFIRKFLE